MKTPLDEYEVPKPTKAQREYNELQRIREKKAKIWKKITRNVNAYEKLVNEEKRLLKRQEPPKAKNTLKITGEEYTKVREIVGDLNDAIGF